MKAQILFFIILSILSLRSFAQVDSTLSINEDSLKSKEFSVEGYIDLYYSFNPNTKESEKNIFYNYRLNNQLSINLAWLSFSYNNDKVRATLSVQAGDFSRYNYASEPPFFRHIYEASAGIKVSKKLWIDGGVFPSHFGYEVAVSKNDWNLTRALNADNTPYYETGVKANYKFNDKWTLNVLVLNGWQRIRDNNSWPAFGTQLIYQPNSKILFNSSTFIGNEQPKGVYARTRFFHDFYSIINLTEKLGLIVSFDIGYEEKRTSGGGWWDNPTISARYKIQKGLTIAARAEYYNDRNEVIVATGTTYGLDAFGASANIDFTIVKNVLYRMEVRFVQSEYPVVYDGTIASRNQTFYTASLSYSF